MNIFVLDKNPKFAAKYHNDKHVVKMILETTQLLSNAHHLTGEVGPYKLTHKNHPCTLWVLKSINNYNWLCKLGLELCKEYTFRYDKIHKSQEKIEWLNKNKPNLPQTKLTKFVLAMPDDVKTDDPVFSYRQYYIKYKKHIAKWKMRKAPYWF